MNKAVFLSSIIAAIGIVYDSLEFYFARDAILTKFYNWRIVKSRYYILIRRPILTFLFDLFFERRTFSLLVISHGVAAILFPFIFYVNNSLAAPFAFIVLFVHCLTNIRILVGRDGADQMQSIVWAGLFAYCLPINEQAKLAALWFIVAQLLLSYITSGISKLASPVWRNGTALQLISRMATYWPYKLSMTFKNRALSFVVAWSTIIFELFAPLLLFFGRPGTLIFITLGVLFHAGIAIGMGLTTFVFAFLATYPILFELVVKV